MRGGATLARIGFDPAITGELPEETGYTALRCDPE
jgi:hypothetical protein